MNKSAAWVVLLGIIVAAIAGFAMGRIHGRGDVMTTAHIADVAAGEDMDSCQARAVAFDEVRGIIMPVDADCPIDAFAHLSDMTYIDEAEAQQALAELQKKYAKLLRGTVPVVWRDVARMGTIYSLRIGFYREASADDFCVRAVDADLPCMVLPVTTVQL